MKRNKALIQEKGDRAFSVLMGEVMKLARGKVDGQKVSKLLRRGSGREPLGLRPFFSKFDEGRLNNVAPLSCSSMPEESRTVKIRIRSGESEAEVEASLSDIREAIELIPEILAKLPQSSAREKARVGRDPDPGPCARARSEPASVAAQTPPRRRRSRPSRSRRETH